MKNRKCVRCKKAPTKTKHFNSKYCNPCRLYLLKRPVGRLTQDQRDRAEELIGTMPREEIAQEIGVSISALKRAFRGKRLAFHNYCVAKPGLVHEVNKYYEAHGKAGTAKAFGIKPKQVEHIVYRYKLHKPRQVRWTDSQILEAAKMAGLVSPIAQARFFNRPNAFVGSIKSLWMKRFGFGQGTVNGMCHWQAKSLVTNKAKYIRPVGITRRGEPVDFRRIILWVDMAMHLKSDVPEFIREAIITMANFQRWLWSSDNPRPLILRMIREREVS